MHAKDQRRSNRFLAPLLGAGLCLTLGLEAQATPALVVDVESGAVLHQEMATASWYPASLTKLMTAYVALSAVREGRMTLETPMIVSARAARMAPSKMGFKPGSEVTLDNALKMIMVKSANDVSVTIAEGVAGSVETFADEMNRYAGRLGMTQSNFVNPNGLPDQRQVTSARDMAILARALYREFPQHRGLWGIGAISIGNRVMPTHNGLMGRYPGVEGMKTGFTCAAGFNVVASANRGGRRLVTVVMGASSARERTLQAAQLFDKGFSGGAGQTLEAMGGGGVAPAPDMRQEVCMRRGKGAQPIEGEDVVLAPAMAAQVANNPQLEFLMTQNGASRAASTTASALSGPRPYFEPIPVYLGRAPGWTGIAMGPRAAGTQVAAKPPLSAASYAPGAAASASPLAPDPNAQPMRLSGAAEEAAKAKDKARQKQALAKPAPVKAAPAKAKAKPTAAKTAAAGKHAPAKAQAKQQTKQKIPAKPKAPDADDE